MKKKSVAKNAVLNTINQTSSLLFQFVSFPYISRILQTDNYGKINYCNSIMGYFLLLAALGTSSYAIREGSKIRDDTHGIESFISEVFTVNFFASAVSWILYSVIVFVCITDTSNRLLLFIMGFQVILNIFNVDWVNNIEENFFFITVSNIIIHVVSLILILTLVRTRSDYAVYVVITSLSVCVSYIYNFIRIRIKYKFKIRFSKNLVKHLKPIIILFFNNIAVIIYVNSDVTLLGSLQSDHIVGVYSSAVKIYTITKRIFQAIIVSTLPRMSYYLSIVDEKNYLRLLKKEIGMVTTIVMPALTGLFMIAQNAILIVSGASYLEGVTALKILSAGLMFSALATILTTSVLLPNGQEDKILISTAAASVFNVLMNLILIPIMSLNGAALTTAISEMLVATICMKYANKYNIRALMITTLWKSLTGCAGVVMVCFFVASFELDLISDTILKIIFSAFIYIIIEIIIRNDSVIMLFHRLRACMSKRNHTD